MAIISNTKKTILQEIKKNQYHGYLLSRKLDIPISSIYEHLKELREGDMLLKAVEWAKVDYNPLFDGKSSIIPKRMQINLFLLGEMK